MVGRPSDYLSVGAIGRLVAYSAGRFIDSDWLIARLIDLRILRLGDLSVVRSIA